MKFIHLTDLHLVAPGGLLWGLDPLARLHAAIDDIARLHRDAAFCVITGDLTERGDVAAYEALKHALEQLPMPVHLLLGNHDDRISFATVFGLPAHGFQQEHVVHGSHHVITLDTLKGPPSSAGRLDGPRLAWLGQELAAAGGEPVLLFMHHPPFAIGHPLMDLIMLDERAEFSEAIAGHSIRHIFFGHAHRQISGQWRGIPFSALPSLNHQLPLVSDAVPTIYSDEPPAYATKLLHNDATIVHSDCYLNRRPAVMSHDAERGTWY